MIVELSSLDEQGQVLRRARAAGVEVDVRYRLFPLAALTIDRQALVTLAASPEVVRIQENRASPPTLDNSIPWINADDVASTWVSTAPARRSRSSTRASTPITRSSAAGSSRRPATRTGGHAGATGDSSLCSERHEQLTPAGTPPTLTTVRTASTARPTSATTARMSPESLPVRRPPSPATPGNGVAPGATSSPSRSSRASTDSVDLRLALRTVRIDVRGRPDPRPAARAGARSRRLHDRGRQHEPRRRDRIDQLPDDGDDWQEDSGRRPARGRNRDGHLGR